MKHKLRPVNARRGTWVTRIEGRGRAITTYTLTVTRGADRGKSLVVRAPSFPAILTISAGLAVLFFAWLLCAQTLYETLFGYLPPDSMGGFLQEVLTTSHGHALILWGNLIGFGFAVVAMVVGVVSFPLLLGRDVGVLTALETSARAVMANPGPMALWGLIVAALLLVGSIPLFVGLAVVVPVLGHATWHLYRRLIAD